MLLRSLFQHVVGRVWYEKRNRWIVLGIIGIFLAVAVFLAFRGPAELPSDFLAARSAASAVSREIVGLTGQTNEKIHEVNSMDLRGNADKARMLIYDARGSNQLAYQRAFELSQYLQQLAESLGKVPSSRSQQIAYEAIAVELSLVSEFISYTQNLNMFLDRLERAIVTNLPADRQLVEDALQGVNDRALKINKLNGEFLAKMKAFDASL